MKTLTTLLTFALSTSIAAGSIYTFNSSAITPNNAHVTTVDLGLSAIDGADLLTISPDYGTTVIGFYTSGSYIGTPVSGTVTVESSGGSQVQFDGTWLTQDLDSSGLQTFALPLGLLDAGQTYAFAVYSSSEQAAFSGQIVTSGSQTSVPEPNGKVLAVLGAAMLAVGRLFRRRKTKPVMEEQARYFFR